jgi:glucitol operon activator protein
MTVLFILGAVVAGWIVQMILTYRQSRVFNDTVKRLRRKGRVSVGVGGQRYRGGRAYVAIAVDTNGTVVDAVTLSGWTTFARPAPLPAAVGLPVARLRRKSDIDAVSAPERLALREAAEAFDRQASST